MASVSFYICLHLPLFVLETHINCWRRWFLMLAQCMEDPLEIMPINFDISDFSFNACDSNVNAHEVPLEYSGNGLWYFTHIVIAF